MPTESVFAVADIFVGRLGADAVATVGLTESLMFIVYALAIGVAIGAAATVARRIGEKDPDRAAVAAVQAIILAQHRGARAAAASARSSARSRFAPWSDRCGDRHRIDVLARDAGGQAPWTLLFLINPVFRGAGDAAIAMRVLWFANTINIVLGPTPIGPGLFRRWAPWRAPRRRPSGAGCGVLYQLLHLTRPGGRLHVRREHWRLDFEAMRSILRISGTATFQNFVATASWMGLIKILSGFGSAAVAGNTIGIRIVLFARCRRLASATPRRRRA